MVTDLHTDLVIFILHFILIILLRFVPISLLNILSRFLGQIFRECLSACLSRYEHAAEAESVTVFTRLCTDPWPTANYLDISWKHIATIGYSLGVLDAGGY